MITINHDDKARFFALQKIFNHNTRAGIAHFVAQQHIVNRSMRFIQSHRHNYAFTCRQTIGFDDDGRTFLIDVIVCSIGIFKGLILRGRNVVFRHKCFGKIFRTFQLRRILCRTKYFQPCGTKIIHNTCRQRRFRANDGKSNIFFMTEFDQILMCSQGNVLELRFNRRTGITGRNKYCFHFGRLCQFPSQRVFATTITDNQQFHIISLTNMYF